MIDLGAAHLALRARALALTAFTTGSTSLSATATGYARTVGSFITDGFVRGMEITPTGFATNTVDVLTDVTATTLTTRNARAAEAAAGGRTITVGVPSLRSLENSRLTPVTGRHFLEEDFVPATHVVFSMPASNGEAEETGLYVLKWYGIPDTGVLGLRKSVDALKARFTPGTKLSAGSHVVRMPTTPAAQTGQIIPLTNHSVLVLTIPWAAYSNNVVAV